ncbi:MAG: SDR family NAD(P)-dependent oxidoreductase [Aquabacterium sp.]|uniref:type I polyketide synthase n=1 Tax=Aquabacterium sp. TaxID=1872578 RepID=UPI00271AE343|nr:type I polyketide synthase [Aquabacterium sp.]MDO9003891.1 SDR family NAD(P)-dependent oxidoreductase [Aquabacterium sp.]
MFDTLKNQYPIDFDSLMRIHQASGQLKVALRLLVSLNILDFEGAYRPGQRFAWVAKTPENIGQLLTLTFPDCLETPQTQQSLDYWLAQSALHWSVDDSMLADYLDGLLLLPLLCHAKTQASGARSFAETFSFLPDTKNLASLFAAKAWVAYQAGQPVFTPAGEHLLERIFIAATVYSYRPMFLGMHELIFGDGATVFTRDEEGHEHHLDRLLNVQASGFQHERYFNDCQDIIADIFNRLPLATQPDFIADMGCGDGTLLKRIYQHIVAHTLRGKALDRYPLTLVGADFNGKALEATRRTLTEAEIPFVTIAADIGDPVRFLADLAAAGIHDADKILHVRSFLDHDRPFIPPKQLARLKQRGAGREHGVYVDGNGQLIPANEAYQSLVEHLGRWASIFGNSGAMLLEVHSMAPHVVSRYLDQSENLHFDAYHAFSGQLLADADEFMYAAAENGLFPRLEFARHYPATLAFCRITINWFEKRPYCLRPAFIEDLPSLVALDAACWPASLIAGAAVLQARLERYPQGQWVIEQQGEIIGAVYTQRIRDEAELDDTDFYRLPALHDNDGAILQLLGFNINPSFQHLGLGDQILDFLLYNLSLDGHTRKVVGVSRCKHFVDHPSLDMAQYLQQCRTTGQWDTVLHFHVHHGAEVVKPLANYWSADVDNLGYGVLIRYTLAAQQGGSHTLDLEQPVADPVALRNIIDDAIMTVLGPRRKQRFVGNRALMELGLDSLDLLELRSQLNRRLGVNLEPMFFFSYGNAEAISAYFANAGKAIPATGQQPSQLAATGPQPTTAEAGTPPNDSLSDIAIIGVACRLPGGIDTPERFWEVLVSGVDSITAIPAERCGLQACAEYAGQGFGGYVSGVEQFDADFFKLSPREARLIDPQHRLLLETAWEALERAGLNPGQQPHTGVFVGLFAHDYELLAATLNPDKDFDVYHAIGNSAAMAAGRLAYFFGFDGPAISIDTACSSSLVAVQLACESLLRGDSNIALAGGVNLILTPDLSAAFSKSGMLAEDGHCKTFAADADGYVRSEGCGLVVLKPLQQALKDSDPILAVIKGGAVNQDGASNGITAPNGLAQQAVMRRALTLAQVNAADVSVLEAHGTGTPLGDPVEIEAVAEVYGAGRKQSNPLVVSSVKTAIGHTESAAGIAGLIKLTLALQHRYIPPHLHAKQLNPRLPLAKIPALIPTMGMVWQTDADMPRIAAISAFGFSGTNAHMIVAEAPPLWHRQTPAQPCVLTLSADSAAALTALVARYNNHIQTGPNQALWDMAASAALGRKHFSYRLAFAGVDTAAIVRQLDDYLQQREDLHPITPVGRTVFLFTGQGAQYLAMGRELYRNHAYFRQVFDECSSLFAPHLGLSVTEALFDGQCSDAALAQTGLTQAALFTLEYALAKLWQAWGVNPDVLVGHSIGEYAAACLAGIFNLEQAVKLVAMRGQLMQALAADGKMAAVNGNARQLAAVLSRHPGVVVACFNAPERHVISGLAIDVDAALDALAAEGLSVSALNVSHAFHSPLMTAMLADFRQSLQECVFNKPAIRIISTLTGRWVDDEMSGVDYWLEQIVRPVDFTAAVGTLFSVPVANTVILEIGPRTVLNNLARLSGQETDTLWLPAIDRGINDNQRIADNLAQLYCAGISINWQDVYGQQPFNKVMLPTYPFQRQRYWLDEVYANKAHRQTIGDLHPLLGSHIPSPMVEQYQQTIRQDAPAWLAGHVVNGGVLFPLSGFVEMALAAAGQHSELAEVMVSKACQLDACPVLLHTVLQDQAIGIHSLSGENWQQHFSCVVRPLAQQSGQLALPDLCGRLNPVHIGDFYQRNAVRGYQFDRDFLSLDSLHRDGHEAVALARHTDRDPRYRLHPVLLDGVLQTALAFIPDAADDCYVPFTATRVALWGRADGSLWGHATLWEQHRDTFIVDLALYDAQLQAIGCIEGLLFKRLAKKAETTRLSVDQLLYQVAWQAQALPYSGEQLLALLRESLDETLAFQAIQGSAGRLDQLAIAYLCQGLHTLGCREQQIFASVQDLMAQLGIDTRFGRLMQRIVALLAEAGLARTNAVGVAIGALASACQAGSLLAQLRQDYPALKSETDLLQRCGAKLAEIWRGDIAPLSLIFPADNPEATTYFYRHALSFAALNVALGDALALLRDAYPAHQTCRILEIGAGTGSASSVVLPRLVNKPCRYTFTDVSSYFLGQAKLSFGGYGFIDYRLLDIGQPTLAQGYAAHSYDIIIASNVLHAIPDLSRALQHCRELLAPGGKLVLMEGVQATPWIDTIFGLTEGWWAYDDGLRQDYPLLTATQWRQGLAAQGLDAQCLVLGHQDAPFKQALMIAGVAAPQTPKIWLVMDDGRGIADSIIKALAADGSQCLVVIAGPQFQQLDARRYQLNPDNADDYRRLLESMGKDISGITVVNCWPLSLPELPGMSTVQLVERTRFLCCHGLYLMQALLASGRRKLKVFHVTQGTQAVRSDDRVQAPEAAVLWGMNKVVGLEHPELNAAVVDLDRDEASLAAFVRSLQQQDDEPQLVFRNGQRFVARYDRLAARPSDDMNRVWSATDKGSVDALQISEIPRQPVAPGQIEIRVQYAGLNFIDVMDVLGLLPFGRAGFGMECVGTVVNVGAGVGQFSVGQPVLALAEGALANFVAVDARLAAPLPQALSADAAVTVPVAFLTAAYALEDIAGIRTGQRVLIHAATGGTGMAAVQIALAAGADVYATASKAKWPLLQGTGVKAIMDSRDLAFVGDVNKLTGGQGVDIVFNSLTGDFIAAGLSLLKPGGCFIEIGKRGLLTTEQAAKLAPGIQYKPVDIRELSQTRPDKIHSLLNSILARIAGGQLAALPQTCYGWTQMKAAFRFMQQAKHTGKIILQNNLGQRDNAVCHADASYLITGGLKGLGLFTARWLVEQGAQHIILLGRSALAAEYQTELDALKALTKDVQIVVADVNDADAMQALFERIRLSPYPLKGIIHSVGVLDDSAFMQQSWERFEPVLMPKLAGAWRLHQLSLGDRLDFFVLYSSVAALLGSAGQANHAAANAFLDAFAHYRRGQGLPAQSINWCGWSDIGSAAARQLSDKIRKGMAAITPETGALVLAQALARNDAQLGVTPINWDVFLQDAGMPAFFERLADHAHARSGEGMAAPAIPWEQGPALLQAGAPERAGQIKGLVVSELATVLGMEVNQLNRLAQRKSGFFELGLDSLTSVEFKNRLNRGLGLSISTAAIFDYPNLTALSEYLLSLLANDVDLEPEIIPPDPEELDDLSIEQAALLLAKELEA